MKAHHFLTLNLVTVKSAFCIFGKECSIPTSEIPPGMNMFYVESLLPFRSSQDTKVLLETSQVPSAEK